jgi:16S rRNA (guanine527-N7)-methyltransferase
VTREEVIGSVGVLAASWEVSLPDGAAAGIADYLSELLRWNLRVNLTGEADIAELVGRHLPDSFVVASLCPSGSRVVDVGSGAGLPAVPFAMVRPDCSVTMVEPRAKRVAFLHTVLRQAKLGSISVVRGRVEELEMGDFDFAVSRATFRPEEWIGIAKQLVRPRGRAVVLSSRAIDGSLVGAELEGERSYGGSGAAHRWAGIFRFA